MYSKEILVWHSAFLKKMGLLWLNYFIFFVKCEWIEIPQSSTLNQKVGTYYEQSTYKNYLINSTQIEFTTPTLENFGMNQTSNQNINESATNQPNLEETFNDNFTDTPNLNDGFMEFMDNVQDALTKHSHKSIKDKIFILEHLKDNLLIEIDTKISQIWQPINEESNRKSRQIHDSDEQEMEFPSNEGALMTIGFLTFAVFLVKLVLRLILALRSTNQTSVQTFAANIFGKRKKRDIEQNEEALKILELIENYKLNLKN